MLAGDLHTGEPVRTLDRQLAVVAWVHTVPGQADYYNLAVSVLHTYAVGDGQYVVHNEGPCGGGAAGGSQEYVADTGIFSDRVESAIQRQYADAVLHDPDITLYVPDTVERELSASPSEAQFERLRGYPGGADRADT